MGERINTSLVVLFLAALGLGGGSALEARAESKELLIPALSQPWNSSMRILGDGTKTDENFYSDFCLIKDKMNPPRWHAIGIYRMATMRTFFHAVSPSLTEGWTRLPDVTTANPADRMWAPFAIWASDGQKAYLYYHHKLNENDDDRKENNSMRVLVAEGPSLDRWSDFNVYDEYPQLPGIKNVAFRDIAPRDPCVRYDENLKKYVLYYADCFPHAIRARTSTDLVKWSEPVQVMGIPAPKEAFVIPESAYVIYKDGLYYLIVCGFDYARMALYISEDPFNFGDPEKNKVGEINGHAPEIVVENGKYYIGCAHIATRPGMGAGVADLWGVYIQELQWVKADKGVAAKIVRKGGGGSPADVSRGHPSRPARM